MYYPLNKPKAEIHEVTGGSCDKISFKDIINALPNVKNKTGSQIYLFLNEAIAALANSQSIVKENNNYYFKSPYILTIKCKKNNHNSLSYEKLLECQEIFIPNNCLGHALHSEYNFNLLGFQDYEKSPLESEKKVNIFQIPVKSNQVKIENNSKCNIF